jgi:hypothetical protein
MWKINLMLKKITHLTTADPSSNSTVNRKLVDFSPGKTQINVFLDTISQWWRLKGKARNFKLSKSPKFNEQKSAGNSLVPLLWNPNPSSGSTMEILSDGLVGAEKLGNLEICHKNIILLKSYSSEWKLQSHCHRWQHTNH